jgi:hypothetical protein
MAAREEGCGVSDTGRRPFRRFPWIQLVFCLACLSMTTWTWMRYSYCWEVTLADLQPTDAETQTMLEGRWQTQPYVVVHGVYWTGPGLNNPAYPPSSIGLVLAPGFQPPREGSWAVFVGRVVDMDISGSGFTPLLYQHASRFTGASVAGLIVGAMGCFIFGLYLRGWLRERKALASQPQQNMIA